MLHAEQKKRQELEQEKQQLLQLVATLKQAEQPVKSEDAILLQEKREQLKKEEAVLALLKQERQRIVDALQDK